MIQPPGESGTAAHYASLSPMSRHDTLHELDCITQPHGDLWIRESLRDRGHLMQPKIAFRILHLETDMYPHASRCVPLLTC